MYRFRYYFLVSSCILIFMGALLKLQHYPNYRASLVGGIANFLLFVFLQFRAKRQVMKTKE